jgi:2-oxoglutarate ferredoxin oxidoreductase subunit alpha
MNILIGGEAGQGLVTIGQLLGKALVRSGYFIGVTQGYQSRIRGGHNTFAIRVGVDEVDGPEEAVDLLVALDMNTATLHRKDLLPDGLIVLDAALEVAGDRLLRVPFKDLAKHRFSNIAALGVTGSLFGLDKGVMARTLRDFFGRKHPQVMEENLKVLEAAFQWCSEQPATVHKLSPVAKPSQRLMLNGNEAIALGSLSAGLKFFAFYPMTPSTSISLNLAGVYQAW